MIKMSRGGKEWRAGDRVKECESEWVRKKNRDKESKDGIE
jgi:hypothetical protein